MNCAELSPLVAWESLESLVVQVQYAFEAEHGPLSGRQNGFHTEMASRKRRVSARRSSGSLDPRPIASCMNSACAAMEAGVNMDRRHCIIDRVCIAGCCIFDCENFGVLLAASSSRPSCSAALRVKFGDLHVNLTESRLHKRDHDGHDGDDGFGIAGQHRARERSGPIRNGAGLRVKVWQCVTA